MTARVQNHITGRLSLRPPQSESFAKLVRAFEAAPDLRDHEQVVQAKASSADEIGLFSFIKR